MIRSTTQKPVDRQKSIQEAVDVTLKYANNPYMNAFGFKVSTEMMNVKARVLPAPSVVFKGNKSAPGTDGSWNITKFKLVDTPQLSSFGFVFFVRLSNTEAAAIRDKIVKKWVEQGMNISTNNVPFLVCNPSNATAVKTALINCFKECQTKLMKRCQMLVCIIDKTIPGLYTQIKRITLTEAGVISQCMLYKHVQFPEEIKDTYISNVALKVFILFNLRRILSWEELVIMFLL
jgi:eukaryotic translation initiation factor 2C